ncbi:MAG TPA: hypothetical protein VF147_12995 [Vicinamibacterales bacterium]
MLWVALWLCALTAGQAGPEHVKLELRVFSKAQEVTGDTRISVYKAGDRGTPLAQATPQTGRLEVSLDPGIYDVQAIRELDGRVIAIRWAERLVVMNYPDEAGHHLEVVNLDTGFGALQVRTKDTPKVPDVALFAAGDHAREVATRLTGDDYALFVAPAGTYDVRAREGEREAWHAAIDVPLDRTRLLVVR